MNTLQVAAIVATVINVLITSFVLRSDFRSRSTAAYLIWGLSLTIWNVGTFFSVSDISPAEARIWLQVLQLGVIFLPVSLFHLCLILASIERPKLVLALYAVHVGLAAMLPGDLFLAGVQKLPYGYWAIPGPFFWCYLALYTVENIGILVALNRARRVAAQNRRAQLRLMQGALVVLMLFGTNDLLPILLHQWNPGVDHHNYPGTEIPLIPFANLAAILYALIVAYNLLQHQFLAVHVTLSRSVAQVVRLLFVTGIGLVLLLIIATVARPGDFSPFAFAASLLVVFTSAAVASIVFPKLFGSGDDVLERRIAGDNFEYRDRVRRFIENMIWYDQLEALFRDLHALLVHTFAISNYKVVLRDDLQHAFTLHLSHPSEDDFPAPEMRLDSAIFQYFEWTRAEFIRLSGGHSRGERNIARLARRQLAGSGADYCFRLAVQDEPIGLVLLGPKTSGRDYSGFDINLLVDLFKSLSLMVNQIRLKTQIRQSQDFELLGKMSRGMAHDLNNLLTPISTLLQLSAEAGGTVVDPELLPVAAKNVKTMRSYIRESLFFSENLRLQLQDVSMSEVMHDAVDTARTSRDKDVRVEIEAPEGITAEVDAVLIQRLVVNLISNAIDASTAGGTITVRLERLPKTEVARDWIRIRVIDHGEGISKENLSRIQTPYFTTKNRGDSNRGFGLGLAICRKIVNLHGGNLSIASQLKKGTTVQVDLPTHPVAASMPNTVPVPA